MTIQPVEILNPTVKTYQVTNTLTVTLDDVNRTGEIIDIAVANGINQADSIQFMLSDAQAQALRSEALKKAVANARSDADTVAGALGVNITGIGTSISPRVTPRWSTQTASGMRQVRQNPWPPRHRSSLVTLR